MTERLTDEQVAKIIYDFTGRVSPNDVALAREVQQWRALYGSIDTTFTMDDLKQIAVNNARLMAFDALIPEVIQQLEAEFGRFRHWLIGVGCTPTEQRIERTALAHLDALTAIVAKLREASQ